MLSTLTPSTKLGGRFNRVIEAEFVSASSVSPRLLQEGTDMPRWTQTIEERFWSKVIKSEKCWKWLGAKDEFGYGKFRSSDSRLTAAHRFSYEQLVRPIQCGLELDHLCRNPSCVNPDHLEPVTHRENCRRGISPAGICARKTHCCLGHPLAGINLKVCSSTGRRRCRECFNKWHRLYKRRKRKEVVTRV
jgi:hypothetical protein